MTHEFDEDLDISDVVLEQAIDWNRVQDPVDLEVWTRLTQNFWLDTRIPFSNDIKTWETLTDAEKDATVKVFTGLTLLDTIQAKVAAPELMKDARTPHEVAVLGNICFMEEVHAKTYSSIFSTLLSTEQIDDTFRWSRENEFLKKKAGLVLKYYKGADPEKKKVLSTLLESFLFYSGFFMPFWWASKAKLTNTADAVRLILRDESVHGYYIGYKFQLAYNEASPERQKELHDFTLKVLDELYRNELRYTEMLYDPIGITEHVKPFIRYQGNKALMNLGFDPIWSAEETQVLPTIMAALSPAANETHDFFSGAGSTYVIGKEEETTDDDWDF